MNIQDLMQKVTECDLKAGKLQLTITFNPAESFEATLIALYIKKVNGIKEVEELGRINTNMNMITAIFQLQEVFEEIGHVKNGKSDTELVEEFLKTL